MAVRFVQENELEFLVKWANRHTFNEKVNGVESQSKYNASHLNVNAGSPSLVIEVNGNLYGDGAPILPNGLPVMGKAAGIQSGSVQFYKVSVMAAKSTDAEGKWSSFCNHLSKEKEES